MPERGSEVALPGLARLLVRGLGYFTWPLKIDDYLELITPLWSVEERSSALEAWLWEPSLFAGQWMKGSTES